MVAQFITRKTRDRYNSANSWLVVDYRETREGLHLKTIKSLLSPWAVLHFPDC